MMTRRLFQGLCLLAALLAGACTHEEPHPGPGPGKIPGMLAFELTLPAPSPASAITTRANSDGSMTALEENEITHLDVLMFRADNNEFYMRHEIGQGDIQNVDAAAVGQKKTFYIPVPTEVVGGDVYAVLIANAKVSVDAVTLTGRTNGQIMPELTMDVTGKWPVTPTGSFRRFPMWGQSEVFDFDASSLETLQVGLLRAVAKIDVGLGYNDDTKEFDGLHNFEINRVWLCNSSDLMRIVPDESNLDPTKKKVEDPTLAPSSTFTPSSEYRQVAAGTPNYGVNSSEKRFVNAIYCAEHTVGTNLDTDYMDNSFLVVEGEYAESGEMTFYRVDFIRTWTEGGNVQQEFLPLLRNHHYRVNITKVSGAGFKEFGEAAAAKGINTNLTVVVENNNDDIREIVYNGQYYLGVNTTTLPKDKSEHTIDFPVETNYHEIVFSTEESWITDLTDPADLTTTDKVNGLGALTMNIRFEENDTDAPRTGIFTLTAGMLDMKQVITVTQDNHQRITVWYEDIYFAYRDDQGLPGDQWIEVLCPNDDWRIELTNDQASVVKKIWVEDEEGVSGDHTGVAGKKYKVFFDFYGQQTTGNNPYTTFDVRIVTTNTETPAEWTKKMEGGLLLYDKVNDNYFQFPPWDNSWVYDENDWTSSVPPGWEDYGTGNDIWSTEVDYETMRNWLRHNRKVTPPSGGVLTYPILPSATADESTLVQFRLSPTTYMTSNVGTLPTTGYFLSFFSSSNTHPYNLLNEYGLTGSLCFSTSHYYIGYDRAGDWNGPLNATTSYNMNNYALATASSLAIQYGVGCNSITTRYHYVSLYNTLNSRVVYHMGSVTTGWTVYTYNMVTPSSNFLTWARRLVKDE